MRQTLLIALLGASVSLATPTLSMAHESYKFQSKTLDRDHQYKHKHGHKHHHNQVKKLKNHLNKNKNTQFVYDKNGYDRHGFNKHGYNRYGYNRQGYDRHGYNKHGYNNKGYNKHGYNKQNQHYTYHDKKPSISVSWNVGNSTITFGNNHYGYKHGYHSQPKQYHASNIYKRLNRQAHRIQTGINNGQLVHEEVRRLRQEQRGIKDKLTYYKRDGYLNTYEHNKLNQMLDIASQSIQRNSTNHNTRYAQQHHNHYDYVTYHAQF